MKRDFATVGLVVLAVLSVGIGIGAKQATDEPSLKDQVQQLRQQVQLADRLIRAEREKTESLASTAADLRQALVQAQQGAVSDCVNTVERANPTLALSPSTFVVSPKPAPATPPPAEGRGRGTKRP